MTTDDKNQESKYSQKPSVNDRDVKDRDIIDTGKGNNVRNDFSRDRERITFTRAFRRLEHKAQVYSSEKGDHFRTRLTHTLEVAQIGRAIARNLGLQEDLVEAIANGHDVGHTPFGHQGERVLDGIMRGEDSLENLIKYNIDFGGFRHSFHSVRILDRIEKKSLEFDGLNLTWQVKEGIMKHTKFRRHKYPECTRRHDNGECTRDRYKPCYSIERCLGDPVGYARFFNYTDSCTLEGQIVGVADEVAQREHDLDDGRRDKELGLNYHNLSENLMGIIDRISKKYDPKNEDIRRLQQLGDKIRSHDNIPDAHKHNDVDLFKMNALVRDVINYFIQDITSASNDEIKRIDDTYYEMKRDNYVFKKNVIGFSDVGKEYNDEIEKYINYRIVNSETVNKFDAKAIYIIKKIFKAYYENPRQMPPYVFNRLMRSVAFNVNNIYPLRLKDERKYPGSKKYDDGGVIETISFTKSKRDEIEIFLSLLKLEINIGLLETPDGMTDTVLDKDALNIINSISVEDINKIPDRQERDRKLFLKCMIENHYAYMSTICDYVSGMTDNYAKKQYAELYMV